MMMLSLRRKEFASVGGQFYYSTAFTFCEKNVGKCFLFFLQKKERSERTPAYRGGSFLLQREQRNSSEELLRLTLSPQA